MSKILPILLIIILVVSIVGIFVQQNTPKLESLIASPLPQPLTDNSKENTFVQVLADQDGEYVGDVTIDGNVNITGALEVGGLSVLTSLPKIPGLTFSYFKDLDGSLITKVNAHHLNGVAASSFLRSDETDTAGAVITFTASPSSTDVSGGPLYVNPAGANGNFTLLGIAVNGSSKFRIDAEGDITMSGGLTLDGNSNIRGLTYSWPTGQSTGVLTNDGSGNLTWVAAGVATDELLKVSSNDTTAGYLNGKLVAGSGITFTENNNGSNETLTIATSTAAQPQGYIQGFEVDVTGTGDDATIQPGIARDAADSYNLKFTTQKTLDLATSGAGGLDTGAKANNTWYSVWVIAKSSDDTTSVLASTSATSPTMPTGYDKKRRVGWVRTSGANLIEQITIPSQSNSRLVRYTTSTSFSVLNAVDVATAPSWTTVDCSAYVPTTSQHVILFYIRSGGTGGNTIRWRASGNTNGNIEIARSQATGYGWTTPVLPLNSSQVGQINNTDNVVDSVYLVPDAYYDNLLPTVL